MPTKLVKLAGLGPVIRWTLWKDVIHLLHSSNQYVNITFKNFRDAMIPCILLALGGNLINGPGSSKLGFKTTAAIIVGRLVLVPPAGLGIVTLADKLGFLPTDDKMFRFVLLLQHTMPTSVLSGAVANLRGCGRESAAVLFWVHIFAIFSMAGWMITISLLCGLLSHIASTTPTRLTTGAAAGIAIFFS
ncbi:hypothetical protein DY000_02048604 [Brassica cretica]|uniref:Auxin efflux carrier component n=1 Tax=Brassica cretica TaxID=69181 RepID=A0ABQ7ETU7_BRACR|nr:hypothetical protein DY000_02048604 [Brassica cretica]